MIEDNSFILDTMTFSYSNLSTFCNCKHEWRLHYIDCEERQANVYAQFGSFCHEILEKHEKGELRGSYALAEYYEKYYDDYITEDILFKDTTAKDKLYDLGYKYFKHTLFSNCNFATCKRLGVEMECNFKVDNHDFIGYIDLLLQDTDGELIILDHKSAEYPYGKNGKVMKKYAEKLENYKRQLYLYSKAVYEKYGKYPKSLAWNYFKSGKVDIIPFCKEEYEKTLEWAKETIQDMYDEIFFEPAGDFFYCKNLCDFRNTCEFANGGY